MKALMLGGSGAIIAWGVWMHGGTWGANVYAMPADQVYEKLASARVVDGPFSPFHSNKVEMIKVDDKTLKWVAKYESGKTSSACMARIEATTETQSKVAVSCESSVAGDLTGTMQSDITKIGMVEQIDSVLYARPYSRIGVQQAMQAYMMANMQEIQKGIGKTFGEVSSEMSEIESEMKKSEGYKPPEVAGKPSVDLSKFDSNARKSSSGSGY